MFSLLLPPRPPLPPSALQALSPTQFTFSFPSQPPFSHLVIFLLPDAQLPPDAAAAVYIRFPPPPGAAAAGDGEFKLLGALGGDKWSAVFRVKGLEGSGGVGVNGVGNGTGNGSTGVEGGGGVEEVDMDAPDPPSTDTTPAIGQQPQTIGAGDVTVGISIEPAASVAQQLASLPQAPASSAGPANPSSQALVQAPSQKTIVQKVMENAFNFLASFEVGNGEVRVPLKALKDWAGRIERKAEVGGFGG